MNISEKSYLKDLEKNEDMLLGLSAKKSINNGMAGIEETNNLLNSIK